MSLTIERLGGGAAFLLHDEITRATLLLGCGEITAVNYREAGVGVTSKRAAGGDDGESDEDGAVPSAPLHRSEELSAYLADLREIVRRESESSIHAVLVTDYRPETCFMLPYLMEKTDVTSTNIQSVPFPVLMTHATRALAPHLLSEYWTGLYGKTKEKSALYELVDIHNAFRKPHAIGLKATTTINEHIKITAYHSGHLAGGCSFHIDIGGTTILYVNDFNIGGGRVIQGAKIPRLCPTAMIARSTFAVTVSETRCSMERELLKVIQECVMSNGNVLIPVYRAGFVEEIMDILRHYWRQMKLTVPIYVTDDVMDIPGPFTPLMRSTFSDEYNHFVRTGSSGVIPKRFDWKLLSQPGSFVLFSTPANISHGDTHRAVRSIASDPKNLIVLSEYCKPGTINYMLYADPVRREVSKRLGVNVVCGVHYFPRGDEVDAKSLVELAQCVGPSQVFLDYVVHDDVHFLRTQMDSQAKLNSDNGFPSIRVEEISHDGTTVVEPARTIALRIHKSMFNKPEDVQGMLIAEPRRKLMLVPVSNGARRLKKKRHTINFQFTWKKSFESLHRVKKKSARAPSSALSFLLSGPAESADEDETEEQPEADVEDLEAALTKSLKKWLSDVPFERRNRWFKLNSVCILVTSDWEAHLEWSYEDEELAGRVLGIAQHVVNTEYSKLIDHSG